MPRTSKSIAVNEDKEPNKRRGRPRKLKIVEVSYGRTVNVGNYESVRFDLTARVEPGQNEQEVFEQLRDIALRKAQEIKRIGY